MKRREALKGLGLATGFLVATPAALSVLQSCEGKEETWSALFLNPEEKKLVTDLVDIILPSGSTPGGLELNLPQFIDLMCNDTLSEEEQGLFHAGSKVFSDKLEESSGKKIKKANKKDIEELFLTYFQLKPEEEGKVKYMLYGNRDDLDENEKKNFDLYKFLFTVRGLALFGYFTSEKVGTEVLNFDPIPGEYLPCIPVSEIGNAWTI
ncbi:gluconate 2-dehydrogenase subunit 3 family protein [Lutimonas zeaxanthinifaciens]|uniref:gluconate 2-dehydrogenase subunit 3 family protein n=1 Tax=Lutimonas zeaxanthinifaciens TaxID=3060215 RepID=UPI00265D33EC|nr:gluconate 2-dehydrogenase subunit 3 family protein [Lutimonas sp. YSD2104]WKK66890.1 gluconate 2-dehydrogenase subunit 3 family protein [Lutimonas sp. YSD2104]